MKSLFKLLCFLGAIITIPHIQAEPVKFSKEFGNSIGIYLDCSYCDYNAIKSEITFVNYIVDPKNADVFVLITQARSGSGGTISTIDLIGQKEYININHKLLITNKPTDTGFIQTQNLINNLKLGLLLYLSKTSNLEGLTLNVLKKNQPTTNTSQIDKWNSWAFRLSVQGNLTGESKYKDSSIYTYFSAIQTKNEIKRGLSFSLSKRNSDYKVGEEWTHYSITSWDANGEIVKNLSPQWSGKILGQVSSSSYNNEKIYGLFGLSTEYSIFPYKESNRRALKLQYLLTCKDVKYAEKTIYDKLEDVLFAEKLTLVLYQKQPWGNASWRLGASHYFHDFSKYNISLDGNLSWQIKKGLSFQLNPIASIIRDQLSLSSQNLTAEQVIARQKQLQTNFRYNVRIGLTYTFGALYNNIVNTRFDTSF